MTRNNYPTRRVKVYVIEYRDGRQARHRMGEDHHKARISNELVEAIRFAYENDEGGYRTLARRFNLHWRTVCDIVTYRSRIRG
ncbi:hypothetical protein [Asticcacaulis sp.]|uniref:hypothetical protein n=1 Tax=Asticcacaulis sp. TaxID=1872648 RepID=UPI0031D1B1E4